MRTQRALDCTLCGLALAVLLGSTAAEAGRRRIDRLSLDCEAPFGGIGYVNESVDTATGDQDVLLSCDASRDFTAVSDAVLTPGGALQDPSAPFDAYLFTRLAPTTAGRSVEHLHRGQLPRAARPEPVYQQTAGTHTFTVPEWPIAGVRVVRLRISESVEGAAGASDLDLFTIVDVQRVSPSTGLGECDVETCSFLDVGGSFPLTLETGATYLLDTNVSSSYSDLGPPDPATGGEPAFLRRVVVELLPDGEG